MINCKKYIVHDPTSAWAISVKNRALYYVTQKEVDQTLVAIAVKLRRFT